MRSPNLPLQFFPALLGPNIPLQTYIQSPAFIIFHYLPIPPQARRRNTDNPPQPIESPEKVRR